MLYCENLHSVQKRPVTWQVSTSVSSTKEQEILEAKQSALYGRAQGVFKNVGFMCFMMWMSGSQIHLFSIMMTVSGIYQPLMAIMNSLQSAPVNLRPCMCNSSLLQADCSRISQFDSKAGHRLRLCPQHDCQTPCQLESATCLQVMMHHDNAVQSHCTVVWGSRVNYLSRVVPFAMLQS